MIPAAEYHTAVSRKDPPWRSVRQRRRQAAPSGSEGRSHHGQPSPHVHDSRHDVGPGRALRLSHFQLRHAFRHDKLGGGSGDGPQDASAVPHKLSTPCQARTHMHAALCRDVGARSARGSARVPTTDLVCTTPPYTASVGEHWGQAWQGCVVLCCVVCNAPPLSPSHVFQHTTRHVIGDGRSGPEATTLCAATSALSRSNIQHSSQQRANTGARGAAPGPGARAFWRRTDKP